MRVVLIGPPQSGKSTLFAAVAAAGGSNVHTSRPDQPHLAVVKVPDGRVDWLGTQWPDSKIVYAELEFLDLPGFDLSTDSTRAHSRAHWQAMRASDMIVMVLRSFASDTVAAYRGRVDPGADVEELSAEMLFADLDQVTGRIEKLQAALRKPTGHHDEQQRELDLMQRIAEAMEAEKPIAEAIKSEAEEKIVRSFAFLSHKPVLVVENCSEDKLAELAGDRGRITLSAEIEAEIAQLPPADRAEFLADMGVSAAARDRLIRACYESLRLVSFLTMGSDECRAWTIQAGTDALTAAGQIHSDIARGFIRAETVTYEDFRAAGDMKSAKAAGKVRLEGKGYEVQDGDIINFRFNV